MSWFAVRDEDGKYWDFEGMDDYRKPLSATDRGRKWAEEVKANTGGSEIIELVEAPAKVVVSAEEAEMLEQAKRNKYPATLISNHTNDEDRLMRAYVNGWEVEKPKLWNVKVPHSRFYYWKWGTDEPGVGSGEDDNVQGAEAYRFTIAEIDHYGLQDCEKTEVTND